MSVALMLPMACRSPPGTNAPRCRRRPPSAAPRGARRLRARLEPVGDELGALALRPHVRRRRKEQAKLPLGQGCDLVLIMRSSVDAHKITPWTAMVQAGVVPVTLAAGPAGMAARLGPQGHPTTPSWTSCSGAFRRLRGMGVDYAYTLFWFTSSFWRPLRPADVADYVQELARLQCLAEGGQEEPVARLHSVIPQARSVSGSGRNGPRGFLFLVGNVKTEACGDDEPGIAGLGVRRLAARHLHGRGRPSKTSRTAV